jgi:hypothetical protein
MALPTRFPHEVREQSVVVKVYRQKSKTNASGYAYPVAWVGANGREKTTYADLGEAIDDAKLKASQLAAGMSAANLLTNADANELAQARDMASRHGIPLLSALAEWDKAREFAGPALVTVCEEWSRRKTDTITRIKVSEVIEKFIAAKNALKKRGTRTYESKLKSVGETFGELYLDSITAKDWSKFLARIEDGVTHNDIRKRIVTLSRWAQRNSYLPSEIKPSIENTERAKEAPTTIGILTAAEFKKQLEYFREHHPEHLAALVIAGFTGLRSDEIQGKRDDTEKRQMWEHVHLKPGKDRSPFLSVSFAKENTPSARIVYLCDAAVAWLKICPEPREGPVCEARAMEKVRLIARVAKFPLPENCYRHSWITYKIALTSDKPATATEAGNSVGTIDKHYRVPRPRHEGEAWFAIRPKKAS